MVLIPIRKELASNAELLARPECKDTVAMTVAFHARVGYDPPWIGYFASVDDQIVGSGGFKGKPANGRIEIAYGTMEPFRSKGIGAEICRQLVRLSLETDPSVRICARTFPEENHSVRILRKTGFEFKGPVMDEEDGEVWEWEYRKL